MYSTWETQGHGRMTPRPHRRHGLRARASSICNDKEDGGTAFMYGMNMEMVRVSSHVPALVASESDRYHPIGHPLSLVLHCALPSSRPGAHHRSLKLFFVLRMYGAESLRQYVRHHVALARRFADVLAADPRFELPTPPRFGLVCFR